MSKKVLVVVDVQKDFYHPDGALYVKGGEVLPERIAKVIPEFDDVIFTVDWHDILHISFKREDNNDGQWPVHCIKYTEGASLPLIFSPYITKINVIEKGVNTNEEEYGVNPLKVYNLIKNYKNDVTLYVTGIHALFCVKESLKNLKDFGYNVIAITDCIVPENNEDFNNFCQINKIKQISLTEIEFL